MDWTEQELQDRQNEYDWNMQQWREEQEDWQRRHEELNNDR